MNESVSKMEVDESLQEGGGLSYEDKLKYVNSIATPMASRKLAKKIYKCIKKGNFNVSLNYLLLRIISNFVIHLKYFITASKHRTYLRNGLKDVQKHIRKGEKG